MESDTANIAFIQAISTLHIIADLEMMRELKTLWDGK